jgi:hypothetical protein
MLVKNAMEPLCAMEGQLSANAELREPAKPLDSEWWGMDLRRLVAGALPC